MKKQLAVVVLASGIVLAGCSGNEKKSASTTTTSSTSSTSSTSMSTSSRAAAPDTAPVGKPGAPRGEKLDVGGVDRTDALAVATAAVKGSNTADLALDASPVDAQRRVAALMTPQLAKILSRPLASQTEVGAGFPGWDQLRAHQGYSSVQVVDVSEKGDGVRGNTATERLFITVTGHDTHGWVEQLSTSSQLVTLTRTGKGAPWQVQSMQGLGQ